MQSSFQHAMHASSISKSATKPDALGTKSKLSIPSQKRVAEELGSAGEECLDNADYEAAQKLFERALKYDPMNHTTSHLATMAKLAKTGALPSM
jgi:Tfp pilus assembly protein PilF